MKEQFILAHCFRVFGLLQRAIERWRLVFISWWTRERNVTWADWFSFESDKTLNLWEGSDGSSHSWWILSECSQIKPVVHSNSLPVEAKLIEKVMVSLVTMDVYTVHCPGDISLLLHCETRTRCSTHTFGLIHIENWYLTFCYQLFCISLVIIFVYWH